MHPSCAIDTCKKKSRALCHCCEKDLCLDHLKQHQDLTNSQLNGFVDQINLLDGGLLTLNADEVFGSCRQKLDNWRDDCFMTINHYYAEKCKELQYRSYGKVDKIKTEINETKTKLNDLICEQEATNDDIPSLQSIINNIKRDIRQFKKKGIIVEMKPLIINQNLVNMEERTLSEIKIEPVSFPFQTIDCIDEDWPVMTSNNRVLLISQYPNLYLFDKELNLVKQCPWKHNRIPDMCWSSTLNSFIIITDKGGVFLVSEDLSSIEPIKSIKKKNWSCCTCSETGLYLTTTTYGAIIYKYDISSSFELIEQWIAPNNANKNVLIHNISYSNDTLALILSNKSQDVYMELRSATTLDRIWFLPLEIAHTDGGIKRICSLDNNEWLVIDNETPRLFHISQNGEVKYVQKYESTCHNATLFDSNILAFQTKKCINFYKV